MWTKSNARCRFEVQIWSVQAHILVPVFRPRLWCSGVCSSPGTVFCIFTTLHHFTINYVCSLTAVGFNLYLVPIFLYPLIRCAADAFMFAICFMNVPGDIVKKKKTQLCSKERDLNNSSTVCRDGRDSPRRTRIEKGHGLKCLYVKCLGRFPLP